MRKSKIHMDCPICNQEILSDAKTHQYCGLCGMGIKDINPDLANITPHGQIIYFCCVKCEKEYKSLH